MKTPESHPSSRSHQALIVAVMRSRRLRGVTIDDEDEFDLVCH
jgi:hypothetical protein